VIHKFKLPEDELNAIVFLKQLTRLAGFALYKAVEINPRHYQKTRKDCPKKWTVSVFLLLVCRS